MHKDIPVAEISADCTRVFEIYNTAHYPIGAGKNEPEPLRDNTFRNWILNREIPDNRQNIRHIVSVLGKNIDQAAIEAMQVSLTDCYWIKPDESSLSWKDVNYLDNGFESGYYNAFIAESSSFLLQDVKIPDFTTNGFLSKVWIPNDPPVLAKFNMIANAKYDIYAANECAAYHLAKLAGVDCTRYFPVQVQSSGLLGCGSMCVITDSNHELISAANIQKEKYIIDEQEIYSIISDLGFQKKQDDMIWFDFLIKNRDRHLGNIFLVRDADTLEFVDYAPLLDNGNCLAVHESSDITTEYSETKPYARTFIEQINLLEEKSIAKRDIPKSAEMAGIIKKIYNKYKIPELLTEKSIQTVERSRKYLLNIRSHFIDREEIR